MTLTEQEQATLIVLSAPRCLASSRWSYGYICRIIAKTAPTLRIPECRYLLELLAKHRPPHVYNGYRSCCWRAANEAVRGRLGELERRSHGTTSTGLAGPTS